MERMNFNEGFSESQKEEMIREVSSFADLYIVIEKIGPVQGSQDVFEPDQLINIIKEVVSGERSVGDITRAYGIRDVVILLTEEVNEIKRPDPNPPLKAKASPEYSYDKENSIVDTIDGEVSDEPASFGPKPDNPPLNAKAVPELAKAKSLVGVGDAEVELTQSIVNPPSPSPREAKAAISLDDENKTTETFEKPTENQTENIPKNPLEPLGSEGGENELAALWEPKSFDELESALLGADKVKNGDLSIPSTLLLESIEKFKKGGNLYEVPNVLGLHKSLPRLAADEAWSVLYEMRGKNWLPLRDYEWSRFIAQYPVNENFLGEKPYDYPRIGDTDLSTRGGEISGQLAWSNDEWAIFRTEHNFTMVPFREILSSTGETFGEIMERGEVKVVPKKRAYIPPRKKPIKRYL